MINFFQNTSNNSDDIHLIKLLKDQIKHKINVNMDKRQYTFQQNIFEKIGSDGWTGGIMIQNKCKLWKVTMLKHPISGGTCLMVGISKDINIYGECYQDRGLFLGSLVGASYGSVENIHPKIHSAGQFCTEGSEVLVKYEDGNLSYKINNGKWELVYQLAFDFYPAFDIYAKGTKWKFEILEY